MNNADNIYSHGATNAGNVYTAKSNAADSYYKDLYDFYGKDADRRNAAADKSYAAARDYRNGIYGDAVTNAGNIQKLYADAVNRAQEAQSELNKNRYAGEVANAGTLHNAAVNADNDYYTALQRFYDNRRSGADAASGNIFNAYRDYYTNRRNMNDTNAGNVFKANEGVINQNRASELSGAQGIYNAQSGLGQNIYNATVGNEQNKMNGIANAQVNSWLAPGKMLDFAQSLYTPGQNMFNTLYQGRHGASTTTSTTTTSGGGNGGIWGAVGSLGAAAITACFTADTKVTTPDGYKNIEDIHEGDEVISINDEGRLVTKKVTYVNPPKWQDIVNVYFENGTVWHTTESQRFFDGKHFSYIDYEGSAAVVFHGKPSEVVWLEVTGEKQLVFDFAVEGGLNVFFANDVAAEGYGD